MTSFLTETVADSMLISQRGEPPLARWVGLYTGNPGVEGKEHGAVEEALKEFKWGIPFNRKMSNSGAIEWLEVKAAETYRFVSLFAANNRSAFQGYAELITPVTVEIGDTVRFNISSLVLEIP